MMIGWWWGKRRRWLLRHGIFGQPDLADAVWSRYLRRQHSIWCCT